MEIKVEVSVTPEELRRFLGLPDVGGLQDDIIDFLRDKVGQAAEFDATDFVRQNIDTLRKVPGLKTVIAKMHVGEPEPTPPPAAKATAPRKPRTRRRKPAAD